MVFSWMPWLALMVLSFLKGYDSKSDMIKTPKDSTADDYADLLIAKVDYAITLQRFSMSTKYRALSNEQKEVVQDAMDLDPNALNTIGLTIFEANSVFGDQNATLAVSFFRAAAQKGHIIASSNLGRAYAEGKGIKKSPVDALKWFKVAALGGHQGSMYNIGLLFATGVPYVVAALAPDNADSVEGYFNADPIAALEWFKRAYGEFLKPAGMVTESVTNAAEQAHSVMCDTIAPMTLDLDMLARVWPASSLGEIDRDALDMWEEGLAAIRRFNERFVSNSGIVSTVAREHLMMAVQALGSLVEQYGPGSAKKVVADTNPNPSRLSELQLYLALDNLQEMIGPLAGKDDSWSALAGKYSESLALSYYCRGRFAKIESDTACFNGAASSAISYYRRAGDMISAMRVFNTARAHPTAATKWQYISQTPRVYHPGIVPRQYIIWTNNAYPYSLHTSLPCPDRIQMVVPPVLRAKPWWNADQFELTKALQTAYQKHDGKELQRQLDDVIALREGALRTGGSVLEEESRATTVDKTKTVSKGETSREDGLRRVFTPHIGVRADEHATEIKGAGPWAEFGPLFDGIRWSETRCAIIPLLCDTLKAHWKSSTEMCGSMLASLKQENLVTADIETECGSDTIVTILRLRPGSSILPHCGTTNRRLIMHFALRGSEGVAFRAGDNSTVVDAWSEYVDTVTATVDVNGNHHSSSFSYPRGGGWVMSYGKGDGHAIVFDDSFEHEVSHRGDQERFVVLIVLAHPDRHLL